MCSASSSDPARRRGVLNPSVRRPRRGAALLGAGLLLAGCASATSSPAAHGPAGRAGATATTLIPTTTTTDPGALPQTDVLPSADTAQFHDEMDALWAGVVSGSADAAMPAFFPESAYVQVKTVADPAADYEERLVAEYASDVAAAHRLLGTGAPTATLVAVQVPAGYAHWVPPGVCANRIGYYEVGQSRVVYRSGGIVRSFGIASLISWRGVWYVVHLGAVVRSAPAGVVDDPESGPGTSPPSSSC